MVTIIICISEDRYIGLWWWVCDVILDTSRRGGPLWLDFLAGVYRYCRYLSNDTGPIGINSATYIGYTAVHNAGYSETMSILGSCLTTFAVCLPSFLLVLLISYFFAKFRNNKYVEAAFLDYARYGGTDRCRCLAINE